MTRALIAAAGLGLCVSGANACDFHKSAHSTADQQTVASVVVPEEASATLLIPEDDAPSTPSQTEPQQQQ